MICLYVCTFQVLAKYLEKIKLNKLFKREKQVQNPEKIEKQGGRKLNSLYEFENIGGAVIYIIHSKERF